MKNMKKKMILMLAAMALLLTVTVGSTIAYLWTSTPAVINTFTPASSGTTIEEDFKGNVKNNVQIKNTGDVKSYIRAAVVITWQNATGEVLSEVPVKGTDYSITWTKAGWTDLQSDGFYYYNTVVEPGKSTGVLFTDCKPLQAAPEDGYALHVEIIAQSIQAEPISAVTDAWGWTPSDQ